VTKPTIGRVVIFRSRTGKYDLAADIIATKGQLNPDGVAAGAVPDLSSDTHVHLLVKTPGLVGQRFGAQDFLTESPSGIREENRVGVYREFDVPFADFDMPADIESEGYDLGEHEGRVITASTGFSAGWDDVPPGTWRWPSRA
jgi:hypothetical protein